MNFIFNILPWEEQRKVPEEELNRTIGSAFFVAFIFSRRVSDIEISTQNRPFSVPFQVLR